MVRVRNDVPNRVDVNARTIPGGGTSYKKTIEGGHEIVAKRQRQRATNASNVSKGTNVGHGITL